ncbi:N-alpha-acetyltransferase 40 [Athalia rosae]|uniref:N-alpha-acetyltransferase 40 n=1 Tax=Athalia rosae TaxID=37344 RepID=UPI0020343BEA|nr:N-alpha-acetyltransferase 40 [Athalia rosae]XP_048505021.1 N-alpha-acetyltransferase 40 [Athalia rosae]
MKKRAHKTRRQLLAEKEKVAKKLVDKANATIDPLSTLEFLRNYKAKDGTMVEVSCHRVGDLSKETVSWILDLMERNMKKMYEQSSWGWDQVSKQTELLEPAAWYLIATCGGKPIGFSHFRFDIDYGIEVLYCYEIQLESSTRRKGLGRFMMQVLESMAFQARMQKVILTVFKHNPAAISFFHSLGYGLDSTTPDTRENLHYIILSKLNLSLVYPNANQNALD